MVDLDDGHVSVPSTVVLQHLPGQLKEVVEEALAEVMHPSIKQRDYVFTHDFKEGRSLEIQASYCCNCCSYSSRHTKMCLCEFRDYTYCILCTI